MYRLSLGESTEKTLSVIRVSTPRGVEDYGSATPKSEITYLRPLCVSQVSSVGTTRVSTLDDSFVDTVSCTSSDNVPQWEGDPC